MSDEEREEIDRDPLAYLDRLLAASGLRVTFDGRRVKRAAREWPDCLPPMFPDGTER